MSYIYSKTDIIVNHRAVSSYTVSIREINFICSFENDVHLELFIQARI